MLNKLSLLIILFFAVSIMAQDVSVHKLHKKYYGNFVKSAEKHSSIPLIPLQQNNSKDKIVFGYLPDWEYKRGSHKYLNYELLTHIAAFDFTVDKYGNISKPYGWPWSNLINEAHANGVKVIMTAVNFEGDDIHKIITDNSVKQKFFGNTKTILENYLLDGVNIDFESLNNEDKSDAINNFMKELTEYIHTELPGKEVSFATPAINWGDRWNFKQLAENCDYIFIMGYSFWGSWSSTAGPQAPLTNSGNLISISRTLNDEYLQTVKTMPEKLILGLPYYGNKWEVVDDSEGSIAVDYDKSIFYRDAKDIFEQNGKNWSSTYKTPWCGWSDGKWYQVWCDDDSSLGLKIDLALNKDLLGIGMWALGYDGEEKDFWNLIERKLKTEIVNIDYEETKPEHFSLSQNFPNPFNPTTLIEYSIPSLKTNEAMLVQLKVYDVLGNEIKTLVNKYQTPGKYKIEWNASEFASGVYIYKLNADSFFEVKKMILQK